MNPLSHGASTIVLALLLLATAPGCRRNAPVESPDDIILRRRVQELQNLAEYARHSPLVPFDQALITIRESTLQKLITAALPYETVVDDQFRLRVTQATVTCDDGLALVRLDGRASFADRPEADAFVEATVWGVLEEFDLDPEESALRGRVNVLAFETRRARFLGEDHQAWRGLVHDIARLRIEAFQGADYSFDIPVRIVRDLALPAVDDEGEVRIQEARIPLEVSVVDVKAFDHKLWISVRLYSDLDPVTTPATTAPADSAPAAPRVEEPLTRDPPAPAPAVDSAAAPRRTEGE